MGQSVTAVSVLLIAYATLTPGLRTNLGGDDALWHFLLFLPLGAGAALCTAQLDPISQKKARFGVLLVLLLFGAATELAQGPIDGRTPSMRDFFADAAGAGVGLLLGSWVAARARRSSQ